MAFAINWQCPYIVASYIGQIRVSIFERYAL